MVVPPQSPPLKVGQPTAVNQLLMRAVSPGRARWAADLCGFGQAERTAAETQTETAGHGCPAGHVTGH